MEQFSPEDISALEPALKIGLLATVNEQGLPHLTLISSLQANGPRQLTWGQFTEGQSKRWIRQNPRAGWLVMTLDRRLWRGRALFTHTAQGGPEYERYNNIPMFRYNAYFGIHTVYFMDLVAHTGCQPLPMGQIVMAAVRTMVARALWRGRAGRAGGGPAPINRWSRALLNKLDNLKFVAFVGTDGFPWIVPCIQAQAAGPDRVLFSTGAFRDELEAIAEGTPLALFGMSLEMEDVLLRGTFGGVRRLAGIRCGTLHVDWAYSPMPPKPEQIYPPLPLEPVAGFGSAAAG